MPAAAVLLDRCIYMLVQYKAVVSQSLKTIKTIKLSNTVIFHLKRKTDDSNFLCDLDSEQAEDTRTK